jgi:HemY protein
MIRIFAYLLAIAAIVAVCLWVLSIEGTTEVVFGTTVIEGATAAFLGLAIVAGVLLVFGTTIFSWLASLPGRLRRRRESRAQARGMTALTRGLEAVAAGDAEDAQRNARLAQKNLDQPALTRLLTAQAAQLAGDDGLARESYAAMLEAPETEFLGLRGLYLQAMARGDKDEAKAYADRAFRLRPGAPWAFDSVYALSVDRGAWGDAREALRLAHCQGAQDAEGTARKEAALLTASAYAARESGDVEEARKEAAAALKQAPGFTPAAVLAAQLDAEAGKRARAAKVLNAAWAAEPHPALAKTLKDVFSEASPERLAARLRKLVKANPDSDESRLVGADAHLILGEAEEARDLLMPVFRNQPTARAFLLMAEVMERLSGKAAAEPWLERAATAPRDPAPGADGSFDLTTEGWQRLVREYGEHGRLAPPPLEVASAGLPEEELLALMAPAEPASEENVAEEELEETPAAEAITVSEPVAEAEEEPERELVTPERI